MALRVLVGASTTWDADLTPYIEELQFSTTMPGGFASCSFVAPWRVDVPELNHLRAGKRVKVMDAHRTLWEGNIVNDPSIPRLGDDPTIPVECAGLYEVASRRDDYCYTWQDSDYDQWFSKANGNIFTVDNEDRLYMCAEAGKAVPTSAFSWYYWIDDGLGSTDIVEVNFFAAYRALNVTSPASTVTVVLQESDSPWGTWSDTSFDYTDATDVTGATYSVTCSAGTRALRFKLNFSGATSGFTLDRYLEVNALEVLTNTDKSTVAVALDDVASSTGLASATDVDTINIADIPYTMRIDPSCTRADAIDQLCMLHDTPIEWGFWEDWTFIANEKSAVPTNYAEWYYVDGTMPGVVWDVQKNIEGAADYCVVRYSAYDNATYPNGTVLQTTRPSSAPASASERVAVIDATELGDITLAFAQGIGDQYLAYLDSSSYTGSVTLVGNVKNVHGVTVPVHQIRAGHWIQCSDMDLPVAIYIASTDYDAENDSATLQLGMPWEFVLERPKRLRRYRKRYRQRMDNEHGYYADGTPKPHGHHYVWRKKWVYY